MPETDQTDVWTIARLLKWTQQYFAERQLDSPRLSAEILLAHVLGRDRIELYTRYETTPDPQPAKESATGKRTAPRRRINRIRCPPNSRGIPQGSRCAYLLTIPCAKRFWLLLMWGTQRGRNDIRMAPATKSEPGIATFSIQSGSVSINSMPSGNASQR